MGLGPISTKVHRNVPLVAFFKKIQRFLLRTLGAAASEKENALTFKFFCSESYRLIPRKCGRNIPWVTLYNIVPAILLGRKT